MGTVQVKVSTWQINAVCRNMRIPNRFTAPTGKPRHGSPCPVCSPIREFLMMYVYGDNIPLFKTHVAEANSIL